MDPEVARIWELLSADRLTILNEEILATASDDNVSIEVILAKQELRLLVGKGAAMICPIASGNPVSRTPKGQFKITAVTANEQIPHRGVFLAATGNILVKDVDRGSRPDAGGGIFSPATSRPCHPHQRGNDQHSSWPCYAYLVRPRVTFESLLLRHKRSVVSSKKAPRS